MKFKGPTEIINNKRLVHNAENVIEQEYNNLFGVYPIEKRRDYKYTSEIVSHNEIVGKKHSRLCRKSQ